MLHIGDTPVPLCSGVSRRGFLQAGAAGLAGLSLPEIGRLRAAGLIDENRAKVRNCITLFLVGSPGHLDTWDMKPEAPDDVRGRFRPIATNVPGIDICEHFPRMARLMDRVALIRSLHHGGVPAHEPGQQWMNTGHDFGFGPGPAQPHMGSVVARLFGQRSALPASVLLPYKIGNTGGPSSRSQTAGYLGAGHEPFVLGADPSRADFKVENLVPPADQTEFRIAARQRLLNQVDDLQRRAETRGTAERDSAYQRAFDLITAPETKRAFDLTEEPATVRDRYGRNWFGQSCLLARRLVERGVRYVTVNHFDTVFNVICWDMHANGGDINITYDDFERHLCPQFDQAYSALILDLEDRGLLAETVVATLSEMGRTPKVNAKGGRDHYPPVWTNFLAGGNIRGGQAIGSSDKIGSVPHDNPIPPPRVLASIYQAMGIDLETTMLPGPGSRPIRLIEADPVRELFG
jgi:uncharacterized protein (DUF1501 family)